MVNFLIKWQCCFWHIFLKKKFFSCMYFKLFDYIISGLSYMTDQVLWTRLKCLYVQCVETKQAMPNETLQFKPWKCFPSKPPLLEQASESSSLKPRTFLVKIKYRHSGHTWNSRQFGKISRLGCNHVKQWGLIGTDTGKRIDIFPVKYELRLQSLCNTAINYSALPTQLP